MSQPAGGYHQDSRMKKLLFLAITGILVWCSTLPLWHGFLNEDSPLKKGPEQIFDDENPRPQDTIWRWDHSPMGR